MLIIFPCKKDPLRCPQYINLKYYFNYSVILNYRWWLHVNTTSYCILNVKVCFTVLFEISIEMYWHTMQLGCNEASDLKKNNIRVYNRQGQKSLF